MSDGSPHNIRLLWFPDSSPVFILFVVWNVQVTVHQGKRTEAKTRRREHQNTPKVSMLQRNGVHYFGIDNSGHKTWSERFCLFFYATSFKEKAPDADSRWCDIPDPVGFLSRPSRLCGGTPGPLSGSSGTSILWFFMGHSGTSHISGFPTWTLAHVDQISLNAFHLPGLWLWLLGGNGHSSSQDPVLQL